MVEIQWQEQQDYLPDGPSNLADGEGTADHGLSPCGKELQKAQALTKVQKKEGISPM
jgi:hypothetical protein